MTTERTGERWRELSWRRKLTPAQQAELRAWLAEHPQALADWQAEAALTQALDQLPDAAVPGNFTALVLQTVGPESAAPRPPRLPWLVWRPRLPWFPKMGFVAVLLSASVLSYYQVLAFQRAQLARSVVAISDVASLPSPQILTNFEAIQVLERTPQADIELLQLLDSVDTFRELLAMNPAERKHFLAGRPPETQRQTLAKIREYESFGPNQRELRLKATELYYYLWPLMSTRASNRPPVLALVPQGDRKEIERRLLAWDQFPAGKQQELLTNAAAIRFFTELKTGPPPLPPASPAQEANLQRGILQWQALPRVQQQRITARFKRFFDLTPEEQQEACNTLSETERRQIEKTLYKFENLSSADRVKAIRSFEKFARLSLEQRRQFLKNAQLWKLMPPDERQNWRDLVNDLPEQPPFPRGLQETPPFPRPLQEPPPSPPGFPPSPRHADHK
jgi:hypothetical protein